MISVEACKILLLLKSDHESTGHPNFLNNLQPCKMVETAVNVGISLGVLAPAAERWPLNNAPGSLCLGTSCIGNTANFLRNVGRATAACLSADHGCNEQSVAWHVGSFHIVCHLWSFGDSWSTVRESQLIQRF